MHKTEKARLDLRLFKKNWKKPGPEKQVISLKDGDLKNHQSDNMLSLLCCCKTIWAETSSEQ